MNSKVSPTMVRRRGGTFQTLVLLGAVLRLSCVTAPPPPGRGPDGPLGHPPSPLLGPSLGPPGRPDDKARCDKINELIYSLNYSREIVLAYKEESTTTIRKTEGKLNDNQEFIVITRELKTASNGDTDMGVLASIEHLTFPGVLLLADKDLLDNNPTMLVVEQTPRDYTVNLPGLTTDNGFTIVPKFREYQSSLNRVIKTWFDEYPDDHSVNADFESTMCFANSIEMMKVQFGLGFDKIAYTLKIDFSSIKNQTKLCAVHKFKQIYYTVNIDSASRPSDLFGPGVTVSDLQHKIDDERPPVIVDSVSYGREIYVTLETSSTTTEAKALMENNMQVLTNKDQAEISSTLKDMNLRVFVMGGSSDQVNMINSKSIQEVNDVITKHSKFCRTNLGSPITYSTQFIKDNSRAVVKSSAEYMDIRQTVFSRSIVKLVHKGWFVLRCVVTWKEFQYNEQGEEVTTERSWEKNDKDLTAPFEAEIQMPGNTKSIDVSCKECTGLIWEWWRTVFDWKGIPPVGKRTFSVWGATLSPEYKIEPEI